jgi:hypothetical protein
MTIHRWRALLAALVLTALGTLVPLATEPAGAATTSGLTVVVMGGLGSTASDYGSISSYLAGKGYKVLVYADAHQGYQWDDAHNTFVLDANNNKIPEGIGKLTKSFQTWVNGTVTTTQLALVAHSMGALIARNYVATIDFGSRVTKVIMAGAANYGTVLNSAGTDYAVGSPFLNQLNSGDVSVGNVDYWSFTTSVDNIVFPYENQRLPRTAGTTSTALSYPYQTHPIPGALSDPKITNLIIQTQCPWSLVQHIGMTSSATVQGAIDQALRGIRAIALTC